MVTIYHTPNSRSLRVLWTLEEMGVKANVESLPKRRGRPERLIGRPRIRVTVVDLSFR